MKIKPIEEIRKNFKEEWLLISVEQVDEETGAPIMGCLIFHSPRKEDVHQESLNYSGIAYVVYSEDWPEDLAACFFI